MPIKALLLVAALLLGILAFSIAWSTVGQSEVLTADDIRAVLATARGHPWAPVLVLGTFMLGALVVFPVNILVLATAAVYGPWWGFLYATLGAFSSAFAVYFAGAWVGKEPLGRLFGARWHRLLEKVRRQGILVVVFCRVFPVGPGTLVNLALGASGIRLRDFAIGTLVGMTPGLLLVSLMGDRLMAIYAEPSIEQVAALALCIIGYFSLVVVAQFLLHRLRKGLGYVDHQHARHDERDACDLPATERLAEHEMGDDGDQRIGNRHAGKGDRDRDVPQRHHVGEGRASVEGEADDRRRVEELGGKSRSGGASL